ncbi:helix-turn-helix transcriptional regulator [Planococcus dechangensis]|uniref:Helix-turn-helix transcriptional regulator n=1 Tax=Planococcus dechangensis TaxID=1176255 RepID=A0ABV9MF43_9BACL
MNYNNLKDIRIEIGMSIAELSRRSKVSRMTISKIENGESNPTIKTIVALSKVLKKSPNEIFFNVSVNHELQ